MTAAGQVPTVSVQCNIFPFTLISVPAFRRRLNSHRVGR